MRGPWQNIHFLRMIDLEGTTEGGKETVKRLGWEMEENLGVAVDGLQVEEQLLFWKSGFWRGLSGQVRVERDLRP